MSYYCQKLGADQGSVTVTGESLNEHAVAAIAKSTAATANDATAVIQNSRGDRPTSISFKGDAKKVIVKQETTKEEVLRTLQNTYREVRQ
jgi:hypothetical protein